MKYLRGEVEVDAERAEDVRTALLMAGLPGWEEHDQEARLRFDFYCAVTDDVEERKRSVEEKLGMPATWTAVDDEDWAHAWKRFWKPQRIGRRLVVKPTWEPYEAQSDDLVIELDPGMAFGTGTHATTRMCMEWLETTVGGGEEVLDLGTGSGILSITAVLLGSHNAVALDNDPVAVRTARENVVLNHVEDRVRVDESDGTQVLESHHFFDIIVANIVADAIIGMSQNVAAHLAPGGSFIGSGIIIERVDSVREALIGAALTNQEWHTDGEWASVHARVG